MSADRSRRAATVNSPGSSNKYSYVQNDPVNLTDRAAGTVATPRQTRAIVATIPLNACPESLDQTAAKALLERWTNLT
jgi:hypothetical protein